MRRLIFIAFASCSLAACSKNSQGQQQNNQVASHKKMQEICLDRLVIKVPGLAQLSETDLKVDGSYIFKGAGEASEGIIWNGIAIRETLPTDMSGYNVIYNSAQNIVTNAARYKMEQEEIEQEIKNWMKYSQKGGTAQRAMAKKILDEKRAHIKLSQQASKFSGQATVSDPNSFAFRHNSSFTAGYYDTGDKRIRVFSGELAKSAPSTVAAAAQELQRVKSVFQSRVPTSIPIKPGFCTAYGFINETSSAPAETTTEVMFRSASYPNLIFTLKVHPADASNGPNIQKEPGMGEDHADLNLVGIKSRFGPIAETILGSPGRTVGYSFGDNCSATSCRPADQAYEIEAETYGEPGRIDRPHLTLHMIAANSDEYKLKLKAGPEEPGYNVPVRPALRGHVPPSFDEGKKIFTAVLHSIRFRSPDNKP